MKVSTVLLLPILLLFQLPFSAKAQTVEKIIEGVPADLTSENLLVPRFDVYDVDDAPDGMPIHILPRYNKLARQNNTSIKKTVEASCDLDYTMVSLNDVPQQKEGGFKYYLDMVLMPKQMRYPEKRAMIPSWEKYENVNKMFTNPYVQFHYYFYIRNLETDDAYITTRFKGHYDVYSAMKICLKQVNKVIEAGNTGS